MDFLGRPVADEITGNQQLQTALDHAAIRIMGVQFVPADGHRSESRTVVHKTDIHAAAVGSLKQNGLVAAVVFVGLGTQVLHTVHILHLGHTYTDCAARVFVRTELRDGIPHIVDLMLILERCPFHSAVRQIFIVVFALVVNGIEEVLEVVKSNTTHISLVLCKKGRTEQQAQQQYPKRSVSHNGKLVNRCKVIAKF